MSEDSVQPISDEMLLAIGRLIITSSAVEAQVGFQILRMISPIDYVMDHAWPLVAGMDFKAKLNQVRTLIGAYPSQSGSTSWSAATSYRPTTRAEMTSRTGSLAVGAGTASTPS